jgi:hypothetical protein
MRASIVLGNLLNDVKGFRSLKWFSVKCGSLISGVGAEDKLNINTGFLQRHMAKEMITRMTTKLLASCVVGKVE